MTPYDIGLITVVTHGGVLMFSFLAKNPTTLFPAQYLRTKTEKNERLVIASLKRGLPAVHHQRGTGHKPGFITGDVGDSRGDFFWQS